MNSSFRIWSLAGGVLLTALLVLSLIRFWQVSQSAGLAPQAYLVLGGSAVREVFAAELARAHPERIILISGGSSDPCMWLLFRKRNAPMQRVYLEHCSRNTFENFIYSLPILESMGVRKVALVTDHPQVERALPVARIILGSHGMAVEFENVPQILSDQKPLYEKIALDMMAVGWAVISQVYSPACTAVTHLPEVDMKLWYKRGFDCQQQTGVQNYRPAVE